MSVFLPVPKVAVIIETETQARLTLETSVDFAEFYCRSGENAQELAKRLRAAADELERWEWGL